MPPAIRFATAADAATLHRFIVGLATYEREPDAVEVTPQTLAVQLEDLFVLPEHRRRGVGTALLRRLARLACDRDCGRLEWAVLDWNAPAIEFYRRLGAVPLEEWTTWRLTDDALRAFGGVS